jgi:hypothetical protein
MRESISKATEQALEKVKEIIRKYVPERGVVIVAGIGNTVGIGY